MNNSPTELVSEGESHRPLVVISSSGTQLMLEAGRSAMAPTSPASGTSGRSHVIWSPSADELLSSARAAAVSFREED